MNPLVSVIVPVYKVEKYLDRCVQSILNQTYQNIEVILINDGSPDRCPSICNEYAKKDNRVHVIHQKNGGVSVARNAGIQKATGMYLAFVDSDDYVSEHMLERAISTIQAENADYVLFEYASDYGNRIIESKLEQYYWADNKSIKEAYVWDKIPSYMWRTVSHRDLWKDVHFPEQVNYEDVACFVKVVLKAKKIVILPEVLYYYNCVNVNAITENISSLEKLGLFLGWNERIQYAKEMGDDALYKHATNRCITRCVTALGLNAYDNKLLPEYVDKIYEYLRNCTDTDLSLVGVRHRLFFWLALHFPAGLTIYGYTVYFLQGCKKIYLKLIRQ